MVEFPGPNPFESLESGPFGRDNILEHPEGKVIKEHSVGYFVELPEDRKDSKESLDKVIEKYERARKEAAFISKQYGIAVPKIDYVISGDSADPKIFTVTDKIEGVNLMNLTQKDLKRPEVSAEKVFEKYFFGLFSYYIDKFYSNEEFFDDIGLQQQYVYGHRRGSKKIKYTSSMLNLGFLKIFSF
ncbi:MAG: hypothetical protein JWO40_843 [Candidatus Doudnabacteria bacterium]|nr:hypothetical protein [Candidatus Doudnabacteria bacterium]